tara:strand:- start:54733 stop:55491 length:759 start_codon:yes stop_codon:yes gene_type:complete
MENSLPTFPPLLTGHAVSPDTDARAWATAQAEQGALGAGDIVWSRDIANLSFALVLEPDVPRSRCGEILFAGLVAFGDAAGALGPAENSITYQWPSAILMNDARIGFADLVISDEEQDGIPQWMVLGFDVRIAPVTTGIEPGHEIHSSTMWDEGCGEISHTQLLESVARHIVNWIHTWSEEGFKPVHQQWQGRLFAKVPLEPDARGPADHSDDRVLIGLDETGNALVKHGGSTISISVGDALERLRARRGGQ